MIVLDGSAAIDWLLQTSAGQRIEQRIYSRNESLHAPHLLDLEVAQVMRRLVRERTITAHRADQAIHDLLDLRITRYPHFPLLPGIWETIFLHTMQPISCLLEQLGAALITRDGHLASASGHAAPIELF